MTPRGTVLSALVLAASACGAGSPATPQDLRSERLARLQKIALGCGLPAASLKLVGTDDVHFKPPADAQYQRVDCVLKAMKKTGIPTKMGFVGKETPAPELQR